jgi:hypothetical protein
MYSDNVKILKYNLSKLYRIPKKYRYINQILENHELRRTLMRVYNYAIERNVFRYHNKITFTLSNTFLSYKVRNKTTTSVSNRYINYLSAAGLINKHTLEDKQSMKVVLNIHDTHKEQRLINAFYIYKYCNNRLEQIDSQCKLLIDHNITPGNISRDKLIINGLEEIANKTYVNDKPTLSWKDNSFNLIDLFIMQQIKEKQYCTKRELYKNVIINKSNNAAAIDKIIRFYADVLKEKYVYKRPTQEQKEKYNLVSNQFIYLQGSRTLI